MKQAEIYFFLQNLGTYIALGILGLYIGFWIVAIILKKIEDIRDERKSKKGE